MTDTENSHTWRDDRQTDKRIAIQKDHFETGELIENVVGQSLQVIKTQIDSLETGEPVEDVLLQAAQIIVIQTEALETGESIEAIGI